ncbi:MAG: hypothetical protein ACKVOE_04945 [Rickettsiales bacterium]
MANEKVTIQRIDGNIIATQHEGSREISISGNKKANEVWVQTAAADTHMIRELMATADGHVWIKNYKPSGEIASQNEFNGPEGQQIVAAWNKAMASKEGITPQIFDAIQTIAATAESRPHNQNIKDYRFATLKVNEI